MSALDLLARRYFRVLFMILSFWSVSGVVSFAAEPSGEDNTVPQANAAADGAQVIIREGDILRGHFTEDRALKGFTAPLHSEGHFSVVPGTGIIWAATKPFDVTAVFTSKGMVQLSDGAPIMKISATETPFMSRLFDMLAGVLAGNMGSLNQNFKIERQDLKEKWQVLLTPRDTGNPSMPFVSIKVSGSRFVERVELLKTDGDSDIINFGNEVLSQGKPSDVEAKAFESVAP